MAKLTVEQVFEAIGLTREQVVATARGKRLAVPAKKESKDRLRCLVCGNRINAWNCKPCKSEGWGA